MAQKELTADIRSSPFIGLGLDESTDQSAYIQCMKIADGKAVTVVDAVKEVAATYKFNIREAVGLGTDAASVMARTSMV